MIGVGATACETARFIEGEQTKRRGRRGVARATGISRNMLSKLYYDRAQRVDLVDVAKLCEYLNCSVGDLFETVR